MERSLRLAIVWLFVQALVVSIPRSVPPATAGANGPAWPLGRFTPLTGYAPPCISGFTCRAFKVDGCTQVSLAATGVVASASPTTAPRGVLVFFSGSDGTDWWSYGAGAAGATFTRIRAAGYWLVQVEWRDSWLVSAPGEDAGSAHLACRPATVVKWVHDNLYVPLGLSPAPEQCGFCVTGNSGGSSQAAYALAFYGMDSIVDALIPTSGPGHAAQLKGCLADPQYPRYAYSSTEAITIDSSYGYNRSQGACSLHDPSLSARWTEESVDTGGNDYVYPTTRVVMIMGGKDCGDALAHASDYYAALVASGTPFVSITVITNMGHPIQNWPDGLAALEAAVLDQQMVGTGPPCY